MFVGTPVFFFHAEDGIRDGHVTGVQTCALPILAEAIRRFGGDPTTIADDRWSGERPLGYVEVHIEQGPVLEKLGLPVGVVSAIRSEERRVGKEYRSR